MRILYLSEDNSIFNDNSPSRENILQYSSIASMLFVVVATGSEKNLEKIKQVAPNAWIYRTNSAFKFLHIFNVFRLATFEATAKGVFRVDMIISEGSFVSSVSGYLLAKKFNKPWYVFLSESNERRIFFTAGVKNILIHRILWFVLSKADCIKVDNFSAKEKLITRSPTLKVEVIKPFIDIDALSRKLKEENIEKSVKSNIIHKKFPEFKFTALAFVDNLEQIDLALDIIRKLGKHFPPTSILLLLSSNLEKINMSRIAKGSIKPFVATKFVDEDLYEYLDSANVFFAISSGEKYEEILSKACMVGSAIIAKESDISRGLIEKEVTGFVCLLGKREEIVDYFVNKTFFLMNNPSTSLGFKINVSLAFRQQYSDTKEDYIKKLRLSLEECLEDYKKSKLKYYNF